MNVDSAMFAGDSAMCNFPTPERASVHIYKYHLLYVGLGCSWRFGVNCKICLITEHKSAVRDSGLGGEYCVSVRL